MARFVAVHLNQNIFNLYFQIPTCTGVAIWKWEIDEEVFEKVII